MADVGRELADRELKKLERKLSHEYAQAEKELRKKREEFTKEYQKELKKKKTLLEKGELTKERYKQWLEQQALYESWVSEMADYMANEQVNANRRAAEIMNNATPKVYAEAFNFGTFLVEDAVGIDTMFTLYNADTVAKLMKDNPKLLPEANIDIPKDKRWNYQKMKTSLVQSVLQGESVSKMTKRLRRVTDMNKTSAVRNARTMFVGAENGGRFDSFQRAIDLGIEMKKMWSATMDSRTRNSHAVLDGETVELEEKFSNGLMYPGDPDGMPGEVYNCRCRLSAQLAGFERNNRHIVNGENVTEEQYLEWKTAHKYRDTKTRNTTFVVTEGKNIIQTWTRRANFDYEIDDIINAQGFDGKPRVVNAEEFDRYVQESNLIAQRGYRAPTEEILRKYQDELYNGKWYIDCSKGGAMYGKGMYSAYEEAVNVSDEMKRLMRHYGRDGIVETFTMDKSSKIITYHEAWKLRNDFMETFRDRRSPIRKAFVERAAENAAKELGLKGMEKDYLYDRVFDIDKGDAVVQWYRKLTDEQREKIDEKIMPATKLFRQVDDIRLDTSEIAALYGYDAIKVDREGYLIVLNRTKVIFKKKK